jgi:hypothetical protein
MKPWSHPQISRTTHRIIKFQLNASFLTFNFFGSNYRICPPKTRNKMVEYSHIWILCIIFWKCFKVVGRDFIYTTWFRPFSCALWVQESSILHSHLFRVGSRAQHFASNLYPYPDHNHQQRPMPTHAMTCAHLCPPMPIHAHPCYSNCTHVFKNCVMCITRLHQVLVGSDK